MSELQPRLSAIGADRFETVFVGAVLLLAEPPAAVGARLDAAFTEPVFDQPVSDIEPFSEQARRIAGARRVTRDQVPLRRIVVVVAHFSAFRARAASASLR